MATDVVMPQMGESIFEGTITKWLKKPGDKVQRDEPLFEISTDKVDAEIPAPAAGVLKEIKVKEGATVQVNTVVGVIDAESGAAAAAPPQPAQSSQSQSSQPQSAPAQSSAKAAPQADGAPAAQQPPATEKSAPVQEEKSSAPAGSNGGAGIDVVMPQMGESIFEGTITKWLKKVGDKVQRDEPLFEISTDKVDAEIPAPAAGVLREIKVKEGTTVQVNSVVAVIGGAGAPAQAVPAKPQAVQPQAQPQAVQSQPPQQQAQTQQPQQVVSFPAGDRGQDGERLRSSPLVRRMARENNVDLNQVPGTGLGGRISKSDIQSFIQQHGQGGGRPQMVSAPSQSRPAQQQQAQQPQQQAQQPQQQAQTQPVPVPQIQTVPGEVVPMTPMRKKIAERMVESKHTSAHVHSVFKVDMTRIARFREKNRKAWEARNGVKLTYLPFIAKALMHGIRVKPIMNASVVGDGIQYHKNVNIGIAVALEWGLIVPVVKGAENLSFVGLQRAIVDLGERARTKKLKPDDVQGGTITITNPGIYGPQFGLPIILQPQVAILGMGGIFKEPVVVTDEDGNDSIAVRHIIRLSVGYDHRIIDGADADQFMVAVREYLEGFNEDIG
ncbi:MAG TPA: 2-oxoglutarate dehydrogenase, E2 component, dihydrolipoamide succinyltransferase [Candidatus Angelobacter sp.]|jgi:2-oxoglutarate dehydrogenase E2 component (dihydrolipoamide succinyltransferase)|nr:2-oxoglutarate dehydrogenase, E2 component, dihydrolipoamide succinyltransferase [Candidatus Angelobacter sp.]